MAAPVQNIGGDFPGEGGKTLIVGLGKTGMSCARYLAGKGVMAAITDSRGKPPFLDKVREELPDLALFLGKFQPEVFEAAERLIVSPGVSINEPLIQAARVRGVPVIGDIELFARDAKAPIIAITGSNGKSTVTTLVGEMARAAGVKVAVGGNLGDTALDLLNDDVELYVLELSSFQLETTFSLRPKAAVVLNVSPDHMDRYAGIEEYAAIKARAYGNAEVAIVNRDDPRVRAMPVPDDAVGFTLGEPEDDDYGVRRSEGVAWLCRGDHPIIKADELKIPGSHNIANALASLALGHAAGLPEAAMVTALRRFKGLKHRTEFVAEINGVRWYNDSKGTNVGAAIAALEGLHSDDSDGRTILIAGGDCKGAEFSELVPVAKRTTRAVILIGRDAPILAETLGESVNLVRAESMKDAVGKAATLARKGDRVLLSPACASFDMFKNFEHRGDVFAAAVRELKA